MLLCVFPCVGSTQSPYMYSSSSEPIKKAIIQEQSIKMHYFNLELKLKKRFLILEGKYELMYPICGIIINN